MITGYLIQRSVPLAFFPSMLRVTFPVPVTSILHSASPFCFGVTARYSSTIRICISSDRMVKEVPSFMGRFSVALNVIVQSFLRVDMINFACPSDTGALDEENEMYEFKRDGAIVFPSVFVPETISSCTLDHTGRLSMESDFV